MRIKGSYFIFGIAIMLFSCKEEAMTEVISFEDLAGYDDDSSGVDSSSLIINDEPETVFEIFASRQLGVYDTFPHKKIHPLDRFGFSQQKKLDFRGKSDVPYGKTNMVTPVASVYYYTFSDTVKTKSAFYNWLDCFGKDCNEVRLRENLDAVKTPPMFTVIYDTAIVAVEYYCEHEKNDWRTFEDSLVSSFGKNYNYRIEVGCGGPLVWK